MCPRRWVMAGSIRDTSRRLLFSALHDVSTSCQRARRPGWGPEMRQVASGALQSNGQSPEQDRFSRETWLAAHLKDVFEMDSKSRLGPQSGLNIPWDHAKSRPRNAKNDCGDGPGSVVAEYTRAMMQAQEKGKLDAARLSSGR
mmetsp:Transcript_160606/g.515525  ORF Transcript_160606/g.515525 Transcript_160606/m.515525 type:complete len:143 (+) Transcript_160606:35-463(+)